MKTDKLIKKLNDILQKLRGRQKKLEEKLINTGEIEKRNDIHRELDIVQLHRRKALQLLIDLKSGKE
jgi:hypothetical protein